jgi:hypothetical protein
MGKYDNLAALARGSDEAGDAVRQVIAGYLPYNPGPGIYSRLERAVEQMPENVRAQELPGLIKRYKDGVPGWELKETDLDSVIAGRDVVPRSELLARVKEKSPVYTHGEMVLGETGPVYKDRPHYSLTRFDGTPLLDDVPAYQEGPSRLGRGVLHGTPKFSDYGQGGQDYKELLLIQPGAGDNAFSTHWGGPAGDAVAHARLDTHGDALRINELQSDLGIHNRKVREAISSRQGPPQQLPSESDPAYLDRVQEQGYVMQMGDDGEWIWSNDPKSQGVDFPMEDVWMDQLIKRIALEAARGGHRAIEIASPRAIADKVGGNIENYEHVYNKVAPGLLERLGRKMGGLTEVKPFPSAMPTGGYAGILDDMRDGPHGGGQPVLRDASSAMRMLKSSVPKGPLPAFGESPQSAWNSLASAYRGHSDVGYEANRLHDSLSASLSRGGGDSSSAAEMMPQLVRLAENHAASLDAYQRVDELARLQDFQRGGKPAAEAGRRYVMSDEMRRRIIEGGIGASLLAPLASQYEESP